jgi:hypothetical protein
MQKYGKEFRVEAVKFSDEVGIKQAAAQLDEYCACGNGYFLLADSCVAT